VVQGELWRQHPPERKAHDMHRLHAEHTAERHAMLRHRHDRGRRCASRRPNARIVKQQDLMIRGEAVRNRRIPAIHSGVKVGQQEERTRPCFAETTVGITSALSLNTLCWNRVVCVMAHHLSPHHSFRYQHYSCTPWIAAPLPPSDPAPPNLAARCSSILPLHSPRSPA
jgi:hypothetical protein